MDIKTFTEMLKDKYCYDFLRLKYKYGETCFTEYITVLRNDFYKSLPICGFNGEALVFLPSKVQITAQNAKVLMRHFEREKYSISAMEDEIISTLSIEKIESTRDSVRNILNGGAPKNENENKAYGIKRGLDFIAETSNKITEKNLYKLYMLSVGEFLEENDKLLPDYKYRHDAVYVVGDEITHEGLDHKLLPEYVSRLIEFINTEDEIDHIIKSIVSHYYFAYLHPYFYGNGRMARLLHMWILVQKGYTASLFLPFSLHINDSKSKYYGAFEQISQNYKVSKTSDITLFIDYFISNVLMKLNVTHNDDSILTEFNKLISKGEITEKEKDLFNFVLFYYGTKTFSTKQLEKDYRNVAYATVRSFVLKFESKGLLISHKYGNRVKYRITVQ